jgi:KUP system potassium uptake protein
MSIAIIGGYNIASYPGILRAFDPSRAVMRLLSYRSLLKLKPTYQLVFVRTKRYDYLMGVILALTGCEATFAKLVANVHDLYRLTCVL